MLFHETKPNLLRVLEKTYTKDEVMHLNLTSGVLVVTVWNDVIIRETRIARVNGTDGSVVVRAGVFLDAVKRSPDGVLELKESVDTLRVESSYTVFHVPLINRPVQAINDKECDSFGVYNAELREALTQVLPATSNDFARPDLTGVQFELNEGILRLVATDNYRLAISDIFLGYVQWDIEDQTVLISAKGLAKLVKLLPKDGHTNVRVLDTGYVVFELSNGRTRYQIDTIQSQFPEYRSLVPSNPPNKVTVDRKQFINSVKSIKPNLIKHEPIKLTFSEGKVTVSGRVTLEDSTSICLEAKCTTDFEEIAFNPGYLLDGLNACESDEVTIEMISALKPALLIDNQLTYLLMPVRITKLETN